MTSTQLQQYKRQLLIAHGLDTVASVGINTNKVFRADNMYRTYVWDVTNYIKEGTNTVQVAFTSAISAANASRAAYTDAPPEGVPPECPPAVQNGFCHVNFLRKSPCSFSWDWGPAFATQVCACCVGVAVVAATSAWLTLPPPPRLRPLAGSTCRASGAISHCCLLSPSRMCSWARRPRHI